MTAAAVLAGPVIIAAIVGTALLGLGLIVARAWVRALVADRRVSQAALELAKYPPMVFARQSAAIDAMIVTIEANPATFYAMIPADVRDMLYTAHDKARELERKIK